MKRFLTMVRFVQAITVWSREMMRAMRAGTTRLGPEVMKWSHSLHQSLRGSRELQPDWRAGQKTSLQVAHSSGLSWLSSLQLVNMGGEGTG